MRIVFMGTPDFAAEVLDSIVKAGHEVIGVVSQPDKPKGRGKALQHTPVKEKALENNIKVYQPAKVRDEEFVKLLAELKPDIIVVVAFGQIIPGSILKLPKYGCINVHASLLPKYRGAAPIQWAVINGEKETGVTIMQMNEGLDTGDILTTALVVLDKQETGGSLFDRLMHEGAKLCVETLTKIENNEITKIPQDDSQATYTSKLDKKLGNIDFSMTAKDIERLIRGLNPWPSAYTKLDGRTLKIWQADVLEDSGNNIEEADRKSVGTIISVTKNSIDVLTGGGILSIKELQLEGKKRMTSEAFLRGVKLEAGTLLG